MIAFKRLTPVVVMVLALEAGIVFAQPRAERSGCPGKITCPQTGEPICRDRCPEEQSDSAGTIIETRLS